MNQNPIDELAWLAFFAQQHGWDDLAERIRNEIQAAEHPADELPQYRDIGSPSAEDERAA